MRILLPNSIEYLHAFGAIPGFYRPRKHMEVVVGPEWEKHSLTAAHTVNRTATLSVKDRAMHLAPASATAASLHHRPRESNESSSNSEYEDESDDEHPQAVASDQPHTLADNNDSDHHHYHLPSWLQNRRVAVAREIKKDRERRVIHLHEAKAKHYVDHCFSFVLGNLAVVCLVLGCVYRDRSCDKPLAAFLIILGCLAPFAACTPILARQWFYLHLRCNLVASAVFFMTFLYLVWFLVGQQWAFESSHRNCDEELSTAANAVVFLMFLATLAYVAKVLWYLLLRVRYSYSALWSSCWRDPYPDAMTVTEDELLELEAIVISTNESATTTTAHWHTPETSRVLTKPTSVNKVKASKHEMHAPL